MSKVFLDTNVVVYLFDRDTPGKQARARQILDEDRASLVISTQVLQEFYVTVTRKLGTPLAEREAAAAVEDLMALEVVVIDVPLIRAAMDMSRKRRLSLWDSLIVEAANANGCRRLLSEDFQEGARFGPTTVENPFRAR